MILRCCGEDHIRMSQESRVVSMYNDDECSSKL